MSVSRKRLCYSDISYCSVLSNREWFTEHTRKYVYLPRKHRFSHIWESMWGLECACVCVERASQWVNARWSHSTIDGEWQVAVRLLLPSNREPHLKTRTSLKKSEIWPWVSGENEIKIYRADEAQQQFTRPIIEQIFKTDRLSYSVGSDALIVVIMNSTAFWNVNFFRYKFSETSVVLYLTIRRYISQDNFSHRQLILQLITLF
jgi:hypothetical protein